MEQIEAVSTNGNGAAEAPPKQQRVTISPLYDRVLIQRHPDEETYGDSGLVKPDAYRDQEKRRFGTVLAVGEGFPYENGTIRKMRVKRGDVVMFGDFAGKELDKHFGKDLLICREDELECILEPAEEPAPPTNVVPFE